MEIIDMNSLLKWFIITGSVVLFFAPVVQAEKMYVRDILKITVRAGRGVEYKIIEVLESGQEIEVISIDDEWANVRLQNGKEGWVSGKYLTSEKTNSMVLKRIQEKESSLSSQINALRVENAKLKGELKGIGLQLAESQQNLFEIKKAHESLKINSGGYIQLESDYKNAARKLAEQSKKSESLEDELTKVLQQQNIKWFFSGAAVIILGFIIGYSSRREKRRSLF
ncbi:MAG: TIGR04211 family SH3 domain-containing protein [Desulfobacteraceae bacterium]|nr:MAG: TIGR04211 family SH3 domain-containing protein [Desulfobacteraceae bacterium]